MKPPLSNISVIRDVSKIMLICWTFKPERRPDFTYLSNLLENMEQEKIFKKTNLLENMEKEKIFKKKLTRSLSHRLQ